MERDNFLSPEQAQAFGLIDHVYEKRESAEADKGKSEAGTHWKPRPRDDIFYR
ncbi:ATP-dependent Clp protease proteolytic subunit [Acinetobacter baumannii]